MRDFVRPWFAACLGLAAACSAHKSPDVVRDAAAVRGDHDDLDSSTAAQTYGSLRGRIDGVSAADSRTGVASASGVSQLLGSYHFFFDALPTGDTTITARIPGYSLAQLQATVANGQTTTVLLSVAKLETQTLADPVGEQVLSFGPDAARHSLSLPNAALTTVYGTLPAGAVTFSAAALDARNAPGGMWLDDGGVRARFRSFGMATVSASQPGAALLLKQNATLRLQLAGSDASNLQVYRFDEAAGFWRKYATAAQVLATHALSVAIDQLGTYAAGEALDTLGCVAVHVVDSRGAAVSGAAMRYADDAGREGTHVWTDPSGQACLPASPQTALSYAVLAQIGTRVETSQGQARSSDAAQGCGAGCADGGVSTTAAESVRCVRGHIAANGSAASIVLWSGHGAAAEQRAGEVSPGQDFCVDTTDETQLRFDSTLSCGDPRQFSSSQTAASCGQTGCVDLGTITCCADVEACGNAVDDDCDGRIDEGCQCGSSDCGSARLAHGNADYCCTDANSCGLRDRYNMVDKTYCFDIQTKFHEASAACPDEVLDLGHGKEAVHGCCRSDEQCGLELVPAACVVRAEAKYFVKAGTPSLAAKPCTY